MSTLSAIGDTARTILDATNLTDHTPSINFNFSIDLQKVNCCNHWCFRGSKKNNDNADDETPIILDNNHKIQPAPPGYKLTCESNIVTIVAVQRWVLTHLPNGLEACQECGINLQYMIHQNSNGELASLSIGDIRAIYQRAKAIESTRQKIEEALQKRSSPHYSSFNNLIILEQRITHISGVRNVFNKNPSRPSSVRIEELPSSPPPPPSPEGVNASGEHFEAIDSK